MRSTIEITTERGTVRVYREGMGYRVWPDWELSPWEESYDSPIHAAFAFELKYPAWYLYEHKQDEDQ